MPRRDPPAAAPRTFRIASGRLTTDTKTVERAEALVQAMPKPAPSAGAASEMPAAAGDDAIRTRAYFLWDEAGRPEGDGTQFWATAERELSAAS